MLKKRRRTARRIFERLRDGHGLTSGPTGAPTAFARRRAGSRTWSYPWRIRPGTRRLTSARRSARSVVFGANCTASRWSRLRKSLVRRQCQFRARMRSPSRPTRPRRRRPSATATSRSSPSSVVCRVRFCSTTARLPWRRCSAAAARSSCRGRPSGEISGSLPRLREMHLTGGRVPPQRCKPAAPRPPTGRCEDLVEPPPISASLSFAIPATALRSPRHRTLLSLGAFLFFFRHHPPSPGNR